MSEEPGSEVQTDQPTSNGNSDLGWRAALPDDLKQNEALSGYQNIGEVAKDYLQLKEESANVIKKPGENATDEDRAAFQAQLNEVLGVPDSIEGYEIQPPELPEGMVYDETLSNKMLETLHKAGAPKALAQELFNQFNQYHIDLHNEFQEYQTNKEAEQTQALKELWKDNFDANSQKTFEVMKAAAEKIEIPDSIGGLDGFLKMIDTLGLKSEPSFNYFMHSFFEKVGDAEMLKGDGPAKDTKDSIASEWFPNSPSLQKT